MDLAAFIESDLEPILDEWENFARQIPCAKDMDTESLRDHARGMLVAIAADLGSAQSASQQAEKGKGRAPRGSMGLEAEQHGFARVTEGFSVNETMAEFRALRASVLRLWSAQFGAEAGPDMDVIRFNEAIDQALTESLARFSETAERRMRLFNALLSTSPDLNFIVDPGGRLLYINNAFAALLGRPLRDIIDLNFYTLCGEVAPDVEEHVRAVMAASTTYRGEMPFTLGDGSTVIYEYLLVPVLDAAGRCDAVAGTGRDITERKATEARVRRSANYDPLTDLPNRSLFRERLDLEIRHAARTGLPLALLFIDLDGFKGVNDRLGHSAGDALLQQVAQRISACVRDTDMVARLGGDEFTVILTDITLPPYVETLSAKILEALQRPFALAAAEVSISGSIGITIFPQDAASLDELVRHADAAMYAAKNAGRNRYQFYGPLMPRPG